MAYILIGFGTFLLISNIYVWLKYKRSAIYVLPESLAAGGVWILLGGQAAVVVFIFALILNFGLTIAIARLFPR